MTAQRRAPNPWHLLPVLLPDWVVHFGNLPEGVMGETDFTTRIIWLDRGLTQSERRASLVHEMVHALSGDDGECSDGREEQIERFAARCLIPLDALAEALIEERSEAETAEMLWVDVDLLHARISGLHPAERGWLHGFLSRREQSA